MLLIYEDDAEYFFNGVYSRDRSGRSGCNVLGVRVKAERMRRRGGKIPVPDVK